jgi:hypothetical protein
LKEKKKNKNSISRAAAPLLLLSKKFIKLAILRNFSMQENKTKV